jgi:hypothetical protein
MKTLGMGILSLIAFLSFGTVNAQTVDEIIGKYINALGGKDLLNGVKTVTEEGTMSIPAAGLDAPMHTWLINGKAFKSLVTVNGDDAIQVITADKGGWMVNPMMGATTPTAMPEESLKQFKLRLDVAGPLVDYAAKGNKVTLVGKDTTGGMNAYKLSVTTKDGLSMNVYIDAKTWFVVKTTGEIPQQGEVTSVFSDYRKSDYGLYFPYSVEITTPQYALSFAQKKIEVNAAVDPAIFDMPK